MSDCACVQCTNEPVPGNQCPPNPPVLLHYFTEIIINHNLVIPEQKPDVEDIIAVHKNFAVHDFETIDVNLGDTTGRKVVLAGTLELGFEYSAAVPSQEVHFAHFCIPFQAIIKFRPCEINRGLLPPDFDITQYNVRFCVEHEQYHVISPREISKVLVVLIWLEPITP